MEQAHCDICPDVNEKAEMQRRQTDPAQSVRREQQLSRSHATSANATRAEADANES